LPGRITISSSVVLSADISTFSLSTVSYPMQETITLYFPIGMFFTLYEPSLDVIAPNCLCELSFFITLTVTPVIG
jgi:hypothetical protein